MDAVRGAIVAEHRERRTVISDEKQYEHVAAVITDRINRARDAWKLFLQLFSAIVAGSFWLSGKGHILPTTKATYVAVSDALVWLVILVVGATVYEAMRSWWEHRETLAKFDGGQFPIPRPKRKALRADIAMAVFMVVAGSVFTVMNPFYSN